MENNRQFPNTTTAFRPLDTTSTLRPARLHCPDCGRRASEPETLEVCSAGRTELHRCRMCGGVWFQDKELDVALRAISNNRWAEPQAESTASNSAGVNGENADWKCPCCGGTLVAIRPRSGYGVTIRRCLVCYGGWIEYAEVQKAESSYGVLARLGHSIRSLLAPRL
jgi:Zn-finger nucleic acid-binding protein